MEEETEKASLQTKWMLSEAGIWWLHSANSERSNPKQMLPGALKLAWNKGSGQMMEGS